MSRTRSIVINGGGIVASALALSLAKSPKLEGIKLYLIHQDKFKILDTKSFKFKETINRVYALSSSSKDFLKELGLWDTIKEYACCPVKHMHIVDQKTNNLLNFMNKDGAYNFYVCDNGVLSSKMHEELLKLDNNLLTILHGKIDKAEFDSNNDIILQLSNGQNLSSSLIIGCDGFDSYVRKFSKIKFSTYKYDQTSFVATLRHTYRPPIAQQIFNNSGIIACLPLSNTTSSLVWSVSNEFGAFLKGLDPNEFLKNLNFYLKSNQNISKYTNNEIMNGFSDNFMITTYRIKEVDSIVDNSIRSFPLKCGFVDNFAIPSIVLAGDSAHVFHPLAGQGLNLGLSDSYHLSQYINESIDKGLNISWNFYLEQYNNERVRRSLQLMTIVNSINLLYNTDGFIPTYTRNLLMNLIKTLPNFEKLAMNFASSR